MAGDEADILVDIPDEQLPKLLALYEKQLWAPYVTCFLHTAIRWKKSQKFRALLEITSPKNCWEKDGTLVVIMKCNSYDVFVFTFDDQCTNLTQGLMETKRIDQSQGINFFAVHEKHIPVVEHYIVQKNLPIENLTPNYIYTVDPEDAKNFTIECPSDVYVKKLEPKDAQQINSVWPHRCPGSDIYIANLLEINGGWGVFSKSTQKLVAWIIRQMYLNLGMLQTVTEHQRKGYASLLVKTLSKELAQTGHWACGTIMQINKPSWTMFEKLGFKRLCCCTYYMLGIPQNI